MSTGLVWHELYMWHDTQTYAGILPPGLHLEPGSHFESPESKRRFKNALDASGLSKSLTLLEPAPASRAQIRAIHTEEYVARIEAMNETGGDAGILTPFGPGGFDIAKLSAGAVLGLVDAILDGRVANGYSLNRPPGHHAMPDMGSGFCMFCNGAIAAEHLLKTRSLSRIAMVDWDVHHGNGAEAAFWTRSDVLTISIHQDRCYPADTGMLEHRGEGEGLGYNINVPLPPGSGVGAYEAVFERIILPALRAYRPDFLIVPSGFDAGGFDQLGRMMMTSEGYRGLTAKLMDAAGELCGGRIAFCHEGGYNPYTVPYMGLAVMETLSGVRSGMEDPFQPILGGLGQQELQPHQDALIAQIEPFIADIGAPAGEAAAAKSGSMWPFGRKD